MFPFSKLQVLSLLLISLVSLGQVATEAQAQSATRAPAAAAGPALGGFCPVCIVSGKGWVKGDPAIASTYDGQTYLFPSADVKQMFDASPSKFVPALAGDCVVCLKEKGERVPGSVEHASLADGRLFLFPNEEIKAMFAAAPAKYTNVDLASNGECTVCAVELGKKIPGAADFTIVRDGMRYQFPGADQMQMFVSNPGKYSIAAIGAYLEITLKIDPANRGSAAEVYKKYKQPFLDQIAGAKSKTLLVRDDDVQVIHGFETAEQAQAYLSTSLFTNDVVTELKPYLAAAPDVRIYTAPGATTDLGVGAYLEITLKVDPANRGSAAGVYQKYRQPFLDQIAGAKSKVLLVRDDDVQVLHGFATAEQAQAYLTTTLFTADVVSALKPYLAAAPEVRIYNAVQ